MALIELFAAEEDALLELVKDAFLCPGENDAALVIPTAFADPDVAVRRALFIKRRDWRSHGALGLVLAEEGRKPSGRTRAHGARSCLFCLCLFSSKVNQIPYPPFVLSSSELPGPSWPLIFFWKFAKILGDR